MARTTIIMVAVLLLLSGGVWAYDKVQPPPPTDKTVYVQDLKDSEVQRIEVATSAGKAAFERAEPFGWKFAGTEEQADLSRVNSVVTRLARLRSSAKVGDNVTDLSPYGLTPPPITTTLMLKDGATHRVNIGAKTVNDAAYYAMVEGRTDLHTINTLVVGDIEKLVTDPPRPTPIPERTSATTGTPAAELSPTGTPQPIGTATPAAGLPAPSVGQ